MHIARKWLLAALIGTSVVGGAAGATLAGVASSGAQTSTPAATTSGTTAAPAADPQSGGTFKPNEDATHESGESKQREAQEDAGQRPTVP